MPKSAAELFHDRIFERSKDAESSSKMRHEDQFGDGTRASDVGEDVLRQSVRQKRKREETRRRVVDQPVSSLPSAFRETSKKVSRAEFEELLRKSKRRKSNDDFIAEEDTTDDGEETEFETKEVEKQTETADKNIEIKKMTRMNQSIAEEMSKLNEQKEILKLDLLKKKEEDFELFSQKFNCLKKQQNIFNKFVKVRSKILSEMTNPLTEIIPNNFTFQTFALPQNEMIKVGDNYEEKQNNKNIKTERESSEQLDNMIRSEIEKLESQTFTITFLMKSILTSISNRHGESVLVARQPEIESENDKDENENSIDEDNDDIDNEDNEDENITNCYKLINNNNIKINKINKINKNNYYDDISTDDESPSQNVISCLKNELIKILPKDSNYHLNLNLPESRKVDSLISKQIKIGLSFRQVKRIAWISSLNSSFSEKSKNKLINFWKLIDKPIRVFINNQLVPSLDQIKQNLNLMTSTGALSALDRPFSVQLREYMRSAVFVRGLAAFVNRRMNSQQIFRFQNLLDRDMINKNKNNKNNNNNNDYFGQFIFGSPEFLISIVEPIEDAEWHIQLARSVGEALGSLRSDKRFNNTSKSNKVDRRASKGRKIRFKQIDQMMNFMASRPRDLSERAMTCFGSTESSVIDGLMQTLFRF